MKTPNGKKKQNNNEDYHINELSYYLLKNISLKEKNHKIRNPIAIKNGYLHKPIGKKTKIKWKNQTTFNVVIPIIEAPIKPNKSDIKTITANRVIRAPPSSPIDF
tara:strand:+ start:967 stop:1281 length:315 start_codon:yes stop_codon:yes gene_type:complete